MLRRRRQLKELCQLVSDEGSPSRLGNWNMHPTAHRGQDKVDGGDWPRVRLVYRRDCGPLCVARTTRGPCPCNGDELS